MNADTPITSAAWIDVLPEPVLFAPKVPKTRPLSHADGEISRHFSPFVSESLAAAAARHDIFAIDQLTDALVVDGLARDRSDTSMLELLRAQAARRFGSRK